MCPSVRYVFQILHYKNYEVSERCVDSILSTFSGRRDFVVVVVDNGSQDDTYNKLVEKYASVDCVYVYAFKQNRGFAIGNNEAFALIRKRFGTDIFLICANSDLVFSQQEFLNRLDKHFIIDRFCVAGPDVVTPDGMHQNPAEGSYCSECDFTHALIKRSVTLARAERSSLYRCIKLSSAWAWLRRKWHKVRHKRVESNDNLYNRPLSGCCLIFSPTFVESYDELFWSGTFLYWEEYILYFLHCQRSKELFAYYPDIQVVHSHQASTLVGGSRRAKELFVLKQELKSLKSFLEYLNDDMNEENFRC